MRSVVTVCMSVCAVTFESLDLKTSFLVRRYVLKNLRQVSIIEVIWVALQIHDRSPKSRPVASLNQSQTQMTRPVAAGLGMQRAPGQAQGYRSKNIIHE